MKVLISVSILMFSFNVMGYSQSLQSACNELGRHSQKNSVCEYGIKQFNGLTPSQIMACDSATNFIETFGSCLEIAARRGLSGGQISDCDEQTTMTHSFLYCLRGGDPSYF